MKLHEQLKQMSPEEFCKFINIRFGQNGVEFQKKSLEEWIDDGIFCRVSLLTNDTQTCKEKPKRNAKKYCRECMQKYLEQDV